MDLEGCESGRIGTIGNRVRGNPPRVQIPLPPPSKCRSGGVHWLDAPDAGLRYRSVDPLPAGRGPGHRRCAVVHHGGHRRGPATAPAASWGRYGRGQLIQGGAPREVASPGTDTAASERPHTTRRTSVSAETWRWVPAAKT